MPTLHFFLQLLPCTDVLWHFPILKHRIAASAHPTFSAIPGTLAKPDAAKEIVRGCLELLKM